MEPSPTTTGASSPDPIHGNGPCGACGHDPACGFAQVNDTWFCHTDDHSCYAVDGIARSGYYLEVIEGG